MKFLYQIHNVGIYLDDDDDSAWGKLIQTNIKIQFDGFEIYKDAQKIEYSLIIKNIDELNKREDAIVVPECSYFYPEGTMRSEYLNVAYRIDDKNVFMWTNDNTWYAQYLLEILFQKQGITFVHGASVSVDNTEGKLLLAFGGIGKTCFIASAMNKERVSLLGDDLILVSENGELYSYPRPFCLYEYHKELFPQFFTTHKVNFVHIEEKMYFKRIIRRIKMMLHIKDNNVYSFFPVSPIRLFPKKKMQINPVKLIDIHVLRRNQKYDEVAISNIITPEQAANFAIDVILHEWDVGLKIILNRHAQTFKNIDEYIKCRYEILYKAFCKAKNINCVEIPENLSATNVSKALNTIILRGLD